MKKQKALFVMMISIALFFIILFIFISPQQMVSHIGVHNVYIIAFLVSLFGGLSAGGSASFIGLLISLVVAGVNPLILALVCGVALTLGDIFLLSAFSQGRRLLKKSWDKHIKHFSKVIATHKVYSYLTPIFAYIYVGFTPLPNDILLAFLATIDYPKRMSYTIIFLGDLTFAFILAYATYYSMPFF